VPWIQFGLLLAVIVLGVGCLFAIAGDLNAIKRELFNEPEGGDAFAAASDQTKIPQFHPR
jgi:hypothetical protein